MPVGLRVLDAPSDRSVPCLLKKGGAVAAARCCAEQEKNRCWCPEASDAIEGLETILAAEAKASDSGEVRYCARCGHRLNANNESENCTDERACARARPLRPAQLAGQNAKREASLRFTTEKARIERLRAHGRDLAKLKQEFDGPALSVIRREQQRKQTALPVHAPHSPSSSPCQSLPIGLVDENPNNPRRTFTAIEELAAEMRQHGVLQPILVRSRGERFEVIAGSRRLRAARLAGLAAIPATIRAADDTEAFELALIENLQREDMNPVEEAEGIHRWMTAAGLSVQQAAERLGLGLTAVYELLAILKLEDGAKQIVLERRLPRGLAREIGKLPLEEQSSAADLFASAGKDGRPLSVSEASGFVRQVKRSRRVEDDKSPDVRVRAPTERVRKMLQLWNEASAGERRAFITRIAPDVDGLGTKGVSA